MKDTLGKYTLKPRFLRNIPLFLKYLKRDIFIRRTCLELNNTIIRIIRILEIILRGLLFVKQIRIEYIEFVTLDCLRRWVIFRIMHAVVFIPLVGYSDSIYVYRFLLSESALSLTRYPIIKLLLILFHSFVFFEFDDLFGDLVVGAGLLCDDLGCQ